MLQKYIAQIVVGVGTSAAIFLYSQTRDIVEVIHENNALLHQLVERGQTIDRMRQSQQ
jgi:hypothetical protein